MDLKAYQDVTCVGPARRESDRGSHSGEVKPKKVQGRSMVVAILQDGDA